MEEQVAEVVRPAPLQIIMMTKGLPGSGKTHWSREYVKVNKNWVIICKDDLREMFFAGVWSHNKEHLICEMRDTLICRAIQGGQNVIICDTNLNPVHEATFTDMVTRFNQAGRSVGLMVKDFTDVPIETCIKRDLDRPKSVGAAVIRKMYREWLAPKVAPVVQDTNLPQAVIFDVDGTLALMEGRGPYDWDKVGTDKPNWPVIRLLEQYLSAGYAILILSGREDQCANQTRDWLQKYGAYCTDLFMRKTGDKRADDIVKEEIFREHILPHYNTMAVVDDRLKVCRMWHRLGLPLFRVGDPDADF